MKVLYRTVIVLLFISASTLIAGAQKLKEMKNLHISGIELGYPCPEIPYYHFRADVEWQPGREYDVRIALRMKKNVRLGRQADEEEIRIFST